MATDKPSGVTQEQYSLLESLALHLLPGALTTIAFAILTPVVANWGYPPLMAFLLAVIFVAIPTELGILLYLGKRVNGRYSLQGVILYRERLSWKQYAIILPLGFILAFALISFLAVPLDQWLIGNLLGWLPEWMIMEDPAQYAGYAPSVLLVTFGLRVLVTGICLPIVEELYFRGYLLPRLSRFKWLAPLIGGLFFALYHLWQPQGFITVLILGVFLGALVQWKRDVRLSIVLHVLANTFIAISTLMLIAAGG